MLVWFLQRCWFVYRQPTRFNILQTIKLNSYFVQIIYHSLICGYCWLQHQQLEPHHCRNSSFCSDCHSKTTAASRVHLIKLEKHNVTWQSGYQLVMTHPKPALPIKMFLFYYYCSTIILALIASSHQFNLFYYGVVYARMMIREEWFACSCIPPFGCLQLQLFCSLTSNNTEPTGIWHPADCKRTKNWVFDFKRMQHWLLCTAINTLTGRRFLTAGE